MLNACVIVLLYVVVDRVTSNSFFFSPCYFTTLSRGVNREREWKEGRQCQERFSSCVIKIKGLKFIIHSSQMTSWNKSTRKSDVNKSSFKLFF